MIYWFKCYTHMRCNISSCQVNTNLNVMSFNRTMATLLYRNCAKPIPISVISILLLEA